MAKVTLPPFIQSISGRLGDLSFRTSASGKTSVTCFKPRPRTTPVSPKELSARTRFAQIAKTVAQMRLQGSQLSRKELWNLARQAYDRSH